MVPVVSLTTVRNKDDVMIATFDTDNISNGVTAVTRPIDEILICVPPVEVVVVEVREKLSLLSLAHAPNVKGDSTISCDPIVLESMVCIVMPVSLYVIVGMIRDPHVAVNTLSMGAIMKLVSSVKSEILVVDHNGIPVEALIKVKCSGGPATMVGASKVTVEGGMILAVSISKCIAVKAVA